MKSAATAPVNAMNVATTAAPAPPKDDPPANREEVQGNTYTNFTYGFRMYKAPSWELIEDARKNLPNAVMAMGTYDESTLMVIGREKPQASLEASANAIEKRLHDVYENYRLISKEKVTIGGMPALEYKYRGLAEDHDWSGTLVVLTHGTDTLSILGMTYADTDLIQIQENVIARSIASVEVLPH